MKAGSKLTLRKGEWTIGERLGKGGFGSVYRASRADGVEGVVKIVPKAPGADRELLFVNLLEVDGVIPIIDEGETAKAYVLAMPEAEMSLRDFLTGTDTLSLDDAVTVARDVTDALDEMREQGIVHRDIKPENILRLDGRWRLADFGISRYAEATTAPDTHKYSMTAQYAAPEQWRNERATAATDMYAFGVIAYEMLTGRRPFDGPRIEDYRDQHLHGAPKPMGDDIPSGLISLVMQCLSKAPAGRPSAKMFRRRVDRASTPSSGGLAVLEAANAQAVSRRAEAARVAEVARSEKEQREDLAECGRQVYSEIKAEILQAIQDAAPDAVSPISKGRSPGGSVVLSLGSAQLRITDLPRAADRSNGPWEVPFDVVLFGAIEVSIPTDCYGFSGKANSLWYCDAEVEGEYAWYELGFMLNALLGGPAEKHPASLEPGESAAKALSRGLTEYQMAWPVTRLDPGDVDGFINRWAGWFGAAANGKLTRPNRMPEVDISHNWRNG